MLIAIIVCSWNRADSLRRTIASLARLDVPEGIDVVVILVDNNSTDATAAVMRDSVLPFVREIVFEAVPGLSNARNSGVACARRLGASYTIFTDDDVEVSPRWLVEYATSFLENPSTIVFGGPISPLFEVEPARWIKRNMPVFRGPFVMVDMGVGNHFVDPALDTPFGANMAFRTDHIPERPFDPDLGVSPGRRMGGEETTLSRTMLSSHGTTWFYVARAGVAHHLQKKVVQPDYIFMHCRAYGHFVTHVEQRSAHALARRAPPRWLIRAFVQTWVLRRALWPFRNYSGLYARLFCEEATMRGQLDSYMTSSAKTETYDR